MEWHRKTETRGVRETERPVSFFPKGALTHHLMKTASGSTRPRKNISASRTEKNGALLPPKHRAMSVSTNIPKAPSTADKIPSPSDGTARNGLLQKNHGCYNRNKSNNKPKSPNAENKNGNTPFLFFLYNFL